MKCQHCGSIDSVTIQGKDYCLSCGYNVVATPALVGRSTGSRKPGAKGSQRVVKPSAVEPTAAKTAAKPTVTTKASSSAATLAPTRRFDLRRPARSLHRPASPHPLRFSLTVAAGLGIMVGVVVGLVFGFQVDGDVGAYLAAASLATLVIGSVLAQGALFYGLSKVHDRRPAPHAYWWAAARGSFMEVVNLDMMALIAGLVIVAAGAGVWRTCVHGLVLSQLVRIGLLGLINLFLGWLLLGVYVARRVGIPAVIVGGITATEGLKVGWRLYLRAGGHLVVAGLEALLGRILALTVLAVSVYALAAAASSPSQPELIIGTAALAGLSVFVLVLVLLEWESRIWLRQYRIQVASFGPAERVRLLTGRAQPRS